MARTQQPAVASGITGSALVRLLAPLAGDDAGASRQSFTDRLSQWLGWTDAIALSGALDGSAPVAPPDAENDAAVLRADYAKVRATLAKTLDGNDRALGSGRDGATDFPPYRRYYLGRQQAMELAIAALRQRLRAAIAAAPAPLARLAAVDAVIEQALGAQEHNLLATTVPPLLERHFRRLRDAAAATDGAEPAPQPAEAWQNRFRRDLCAVLLAELDLRCQPIDGLLAALHSSSRA
ncbi:DUF3348 family protein [Xylophilus sp.]|uniref:DUF3348 family protein n=1 Tax=Xylophilus sp. TaxID=2653893 RepID=UPI0013B97EAE|nr:DUF3348 family protein [Xylophilus sp.]KAF1045258.1 MAG: hypothetical protein GAK38_03096 [Xylophilus sp.]